MRAITGRLKKEPEFQRIPIKGCSSIRNAFASREGAVSINIDYSSLELRILAMCDPIYALQNLRGTNMQKLVKGTKYRLNIPDYELTADNASWHGKIVTLNTLFISPCNCNQCYRCAYATQVGEYTAFVTAPGLSSAFYGNVLRAKPAWLGPYDKIPCDCPWSVVSSRGCQNKAKHI